MVGWYYIKKKTQSNAGKGTAVCSPRNLSFMHCMRSYATINGLKKNRERKKKKGNSCRIRKKTRYVGIEN